MVTVKNFMKTHCWSNEVTFYEKFLIVKLTEVTDNFQVSRQHIVSV